MRGHIWTAWGHLRDRLQPTRLLANAWQTELDDRVLGSIRLTGWLDQPESDTLALLVHGMGGHSESGYVMRMAAAAHRRGYATLRLSLRGADRSGADFYHAGLTDDLRAALASPELAAYRRIVVIGFSLGGHVALRLAAEGDHGVSAFAAICAPVDLSASCAVIDRRRALPYRRHLLKGLSEIYIAASHRHGSMPISARQAREIRTLREWDARTVAPRFGFASAEDYYRQMSVGPRLGSIDTPTLFVASDADPMVTAPTVLGALAQHSPQIEVRWLHAGGHVAFPAATRVEDQVLGWLRG